MQSKIFNQKSKIINGFTLIEMLIVLTIISFMTLGFVNKFQVDNTAVNNLAGQEIVFYLQDTKQRVLSNNVDGLNPQVDCQSGQCILGINLKNDSEYNIFVDRNNPPNYVFDQADLVIKNIILPDKLKYKSEITNIIFEPPYGNVRILNSRNDIMDCLLWCEIKILDQKNNEMIIKINNQGVSYVEGK